MKINAKVYEHANVNSTSGAFVLPDIPILGTHLKIKVGNKEENIMPKCTLFYEIGKEYAGKCFEQVLFDFDTTNFTSTKFILSAFISGLSRLSSHFFESNPDLYPFKKIKLQIRNEQKVDVEIFSIPNQRDYISYNGRCYRCSDIYYENGIISVEADHDIAIEEFYQNCYY